MCLVLLPNIWPSENNGLINSKPTYFFPDTESEMLDLYSSHVVPGCQLSLQRKQNIPPHCKTVKTVTFHLTAWNRNQNTVTSVESNEGKGMLLLWVQQNAYSIWGEGGVRGGDKGQVHKIIQHWTLQVTMNIFTSSQTVGCATPGTPLHTPSHPAVGQKALVLSTATSVFREIK